MSSNKRRPLRGLFSRASYDRDAAAYSEVSPGTLSARPGLGHRRLDSGTSDFSDSRLSHADDLDREVLEEEEEREKLLSRGGLFGSAGVRVGKKIHGGRRKRVGDVAEMMGGKRLGMEEGGEFGLDSGDEEGSEEDDELLGEKTVEKVRAHRMNWMDK